MQAMLKVKFYKIQSSENFTPKVKTFMIYVCLLSAQSSAVAKVEQWQATTTHREDLWTTVISLNYGNAKWSKTDVSQCKKYNKTNEKTGRKH